MNASKKKEILLHSLLTVILLALCALWLMNTIRHSPSWTPPPGAPPPEFSEIPQGRPGHGMPEGKRRGPVRPETMIILFGIVLTATANFVSRSYIKNRQQKQRVKDLEYENLSNQLETLRFQINPHFFMNTLNNIHALIDLDSEKAKESIEEFSKLMRIVLYEGNAPTIPLSREIEFLSHYISLMRLRYPPEVKITTSFPDNTESISIPPLLMASFVENAFKHGISYEQDSFVHVSIVKEDGKLIFRCANSRVKEELSTQHGLGLDNTRKRLDLIYGNSYTLNIDVSEKVYDVILILPL